MRRGWRAHFEGSQIMRPIRTLFLLVLVAGCTRDGTQVATLSAATVKQNGLGDSGVVLRRIAVDSAGFEFLSPSPDGRLFVGVDPELNVLGAESNNLVVRDTRTGGRRLLRRAPSAMAAYVASSVVSPDGSSLAFVWFTGAQTYRYELRTIGLDGSRERTLLQTGPALEYFELTDWSPDGRSVLAVLSGKDKSNQIALVSTTDGSVRVLKSLDWRTPGGLKFSPNGSSIAYDFQPKQDAAARELFVLAADGSRETRISGDGSVKSVVGWSLNDQGIYYTTRQDDATTVWFQPLVDGRADGPAQIVRSDIWGMSTIGLARGALYYLVSSAKRAVYSFSVDFESGRILAPPTPVVSGTDILPGGPAVWSHDGSHFAYVRRVRTPSAGRHVVIIRNLATGEEREVPVALEYLSLREWSADGRAITAIGKFRGRDGRYRIDLATGRADLIDHAVRSVDIPLLSPDGKTEYSVRRLEGADSRSLIASSVETHRDHELYRGGGFIGALRLAPSGKNLALLDGDTGNTAVVKMVDLQSGVHRTVYSTRGPSFVGSASLNWTPDGRFLLLRAWNATARRDEFWKAPADAGAAELLLSVGEGGVTYPSISPDGRRIAFMGSTGGKSRELWVMENLPGSRSRAKDDRERGTGPRP